MSQTAPTAAETIADMERLATMAAVSETINTALLFCGRLPRDRAERIALTLGSLVMVSWRAIEDDGGSNAERDELARQAARAFIGMIGGWR